MNLKFGTALAALLGLSLAGETSFAAPILSPGDAIVGIDLDPAKSNSSYPGAEAPAFAVDGVITTKYLNFAGAGSGLIVRPNIPFNSIAKGIRLTTAGDEPGRDPSSFQVWGTTNAITSLDN